MCKNVFLLSLLLVIGFCSCEEEEDVTGSFGECIIDTDTLRINFIAGAWALDTVRVVNFYPDSTGKGISNGYLSVDFGGMNYQDFRWVDTSALLGYDIDLRWMVGDSMDMLPDIMKSYAFDIEPHCDSLLLRDQNDVVVKLIR